MNLKDGNCSRNLPILDSLRLNASNVYSKDPKLSYYYGICLQEVSRNSEAIVELNYYLKFFPNDLKAHINLGHCYFTLGNMEKAYQEFKFIEERDPDFGIINFNLGVYFLKHEDYEKALRYFEKEELLNKHPTNAPLYLYKARALVNLNRWEEAINIYNQIPFADFSYADIIEYTFAIMELNNNYDRAEEIMLNFALNDKDNPDVYNSLAQIALYAGGLERARGYLRISNKKDSTFEGNARSFLLKAELYRRLDLKDSCCVLIREFNLQDYFEVSEIKADCCD